MKYDKHQIQNIFQKFYFHSARKQIDKYYIYGIIFRYKDKLYHYFSSAFRKTIDMMCFCMKID